MTALKKYQKLESPGLWRDTAEARRREVVVAFGEASLILSDPRSGTVLAHWSLPAVVRLNPGGAPALYAPGAEAIETLEIDDLTMSGAIETVRGAIEAARPHPGRLRGRLGLAGGAVLAALAVFWLPGALIRSTAAMLPPAARAEIGRMALADVMRIAGTPCTGAAGGRALARLADQLFGPGTMRLVVLREGIDPAAHLPGGVILLSRRLVEQPDGPEVAAGFALAEALRAERTDPMVPVLDHAGLFATLRLLTSGALPDGALDGYAERLARTAPAPLPAETLLTRMAGAGVPASPYAYALAAPEEVALPLIEGDPRRGLPPVPLMADADWVAMQGVCAE